MNKPILWISVFVVAVLTIFAGLANANPGIVVNVDNFNPSTINPEQKTLCTVSVESITTEEENVRLTVNASSPLSFNWTYMEIVLEPGVTKDITLEVTHTSDEAGDYAFTVEGLAWPTIWTYEDAENTGFMETSSFTANLSVIDEGTDLPILYIVAIIVGAVIVGGIILFLKKAA